MNARMSIRDEKFIVSMKISEDGGDYSITL